MKKLIPALAVFMVLLAVPLAGLDAQEPIRVEVPGAGPTMVPCNGPDCGTCELVTMANTIIRWLIGTLFVVFAVIMAVAGFGLVTSGGSQSALDAAKSKFQNALIGIIIVLAAWLIVDTLLRGILAGGTGSISGYGPWSEVQCTAQATPQETRPEPPGAVTTEPTTPTTPGTPSAPGTPTTPGTPLTQAQAEARLTEGGVSLKPGARLEGIQSHVIDGVVALNRACNCNIVVTEGTGGTHSSGTYSHANGYKLDLRTRDNPALVNYVRTNYTPAGQWNDGTPLYRNGNATYAMESDHIDVVYRP